jgi:hypothetical protein
MELDSLGQKVVEAIATDSLPTRAGEGDRSEAKAERRRKIA